MLLYSFTSKWLKRGKWHGKQAHQDVRKSQIQNEKVGNTVHVFFANYHIANQDIAEYADTKNDQIQ